MAFFNILAQNCMKWKRGDNPDVPEVMSKTKEIIKGFNDLYGPAFEQILYREKRDDGSVYDHGCEDWKKAKNRVLINELLKKTIDEVGFSMQLKKLTTELQKKDTVTNQIPEVPEVLGDEIV